MTNKKFDEQVRTICHSNKINIPVLYEWYDNVLKQMELMKERHKAIQNPRHLGDAREDELIKLLVDILPPSFVTAKGYAINTIASPSQEQDIMICKPEYYTNLYKTDGVSYIPIDSVLSSIQVKSTLTRDELQKTVLNCASIKSLTLAPFSKTGKPLFELPFTLFAYSSNFSLDEIITKLEKLNVNLPVHYQINMIYVLGKGLILPKNKNGDRLLSTDITALGKYVSVSEIKLDNLPAASHALPFLWFLACLVDNIVQLDKKREHKGLLPYFFGPYSLQNHVNEQIKKRDSEIIDGKKCVPINT